MDILARHSDNPILTAEQVPYPASQIFNAGVTYFRGQYQMVFRNDVFDPQTLRNTGTNIGRATSDDGVEWSVSPKPCFEMSTGEIHRAYDPRLTVLEDRCWMCFAVDTRHGIRGGLAVTDDLEDFEFVSLSAPDNRNMVLFPERVGGRMARLERPFPIYGRGAAEAFDIWYSDSPDGRDWGNVHLVLGSDEVPWVNNKIGPAAPPVRTPQGWLTLFHGVWKDENRPLATWQKNPWVKQYMAGVMLLDLDEPWRVIGISREPILTPRPEYPYEMEGFRGSVIFPGGMILEDSGEVKVYYGAADTVEALATCMVDDLLTACEPWEPKR